MDRTLLYIDPDPATRLLVRKVLAPEGFIVLQAKTALEGQQSAARTRPDLILVDVDLVKAAELVPALRQSPGLEHIRLLASTAHAWPEHLEKMIAWGFDRVLLKPLDVDTLGRELVSVLAPTEPAQPAPAEPATEPVEPATEPVEPAMELVEPAMEPVSLRWSRATSEWNAAGGCRHGARCDRSPRGSAGGRSSGQRAAGGRT